MFGPYKHRGFGGVPLPLDTDNPVGQGTFWCRIPEGTNTIKTTVWNPSDETLKISVMVNDLSVNETDIAPGKYLTVPGRINKLQTNIKITYQGDRRLVVLETRFETAMDLIQ